MKKKNGAKKSGVRGPGLALNFARQLLARRERLDLTQAELAARIGHTASAVAMLEQGARVPSLEMVEHCAGALGCGGEPWKLFLPRGR